MFIVPTISILFMCFGLSAALSLWSKLSSNKLYEECQKLSRTEEFRKMIEKLLQEHKIPILVKADKDDTALWNDANYGNRLSEIQSFMAEVKFHAKVYANPPRGYGYAESGEPTEEDVAYKQAEDFHIKTHPELLKIMKEECGKKGTFCGIKYRVITVKEVLKESIECAVRVHKTKEQKMAKGKTGKEDKVTTKMWVDLDTKFKGELEKICVSSFDCRNWCQCPLMMIKCRQHVWNFWKEKQCQL